MISASNAFNTAIEETSRQFTARFLVDGVTLDCDIENVKCHKGSCGNELSIGSVYASYIEASLKKCSTSLRNKELTYQVGLMVNGSYEYITMGKYTVLDPKESNGAITFTAVSTLSLKANLIYNAPYTHIVDIMTRLQSLSGVSIDYSDFSIYPYSEASTHLPTDGTFRDSIGIAGCLLGGFVTEDISGNIVIKKYNSGETVPILPYRCSALPEFDTPYWVDGIKIIVKEADDVNPEEAYTHGTPMIIQKCECMSQGLFEAMRLNVEGLHFDVGKVQIALGDPRIEPWDIIAVTDLKNNTHNVPCFEIVHTFNGGFETEVTAQVGGTDVNSKNVKGALEKAVDRLGGDVLAAAVAAGRAEDLATQAQQSADDAQQSADDAQTSADEAARQAGIATTNANEAIRQAGIATTNANTAVEQAGIATGYANEAKQQATNATNSANDALVQLATVESVINTLDWITSHATVTKDTSVVANKNYYIRNQDGTFTKVAEPSGNPKTQGWYEMDEAIADYVAAHVALTDYGLNLKVDNSSYRIHIGTYTNGGDEGVYIIDGSGNVVSFFGEDIRFGSDRAQYIGNNTAYIIFDPEAASGNGALTIGGATINLSGRTLEEVLADKLDSVDVSVTQTSAGANITINGDTVSLSNGAPGASGKLLYGTSSTTASTATKAVICSDATELYAGFTITVKFSTANTALSPQLNVNSLGAKAIWVDNAVTSTSNCLFWNTNAVITFVYDGTQFLVADQANSYYTTCSTAAGTTAKAAACATCVVRKGTTVTVRMTYAHTGSSAATLYVNGQSGTARNIYVNGSTVTSTSGNSWADGEAVPFVFNGQYWYASKGEKGDTGAQGPQGDQGIQGPQGTSVTSTTPYYKLGTTTPAKPSDNTQPTGWSVTQPAFDNTQNCYVVTQVVFSGGGIRYSDVSTLSEYEASKMVYETAERVREAIEGDDENDGLRAVVGRLTEAITINADQNNPSITIKAGEATETAAFQVTESMLQFVRLTYGESQEDAVYERLAYIDASAEESAFGIDTAKIDNALRIGELELFALNGGIGIRRT